MVRKLTEDRCTTGLLRQLPPPHSVGSGVAERATGPGLGACVFQELGLDQRVDGLAKLLGLTGANAALTISAVPESDVGDGRRGWRW